MVQPLGVDVEVALDLDEGARPKAFLLAREKQRQDGCEGFVRARPGGALGASGVAPELDLGVQKRRLLARLVRSERGCRSNVEASLL